MAADTVVHVAAGCKLECEKYIRLGVDGLVQTHDVWMLKFFHRLDLSLHFLLHAQLADLVHLRCCLALPRGDRVGRSALARRVVDAKVPRVGRRLDGRASCTYLLRQGSAQRPI